MRFEEDDDESKMDVNKKRLKDGLRRGAVK